MSCPTFIAECMALRTAVHYAHILSKSYAEHVALGAFYGALMDLTDRYAEVYMGLARQPARLPGAFYGALTDLTDRYAEVYMGLARQPARLPGASLPTGTPIELLTDFLDTIRDEFSEDEHESEALKNILAEMEELTAQTLYKLKNLK